jgi:hypothetical protein
MSPLRSILEFGLVRLILMLAALVVVCALGRPAHAGHVFFLGIGNELAEAKADTATTFQTLAKYAPRPNDLELALDRTGAQIVNLLDGFRGAVSPGDVFIFHYAGHGTSAPNDLAPVDENNDPTTLGGANNGVDGAIGLGADFDAAKQRRDDAVGALLREFKDGVAMLSIFDACFAGELVDGTADVNRGLVIGTSDATHCVQATPFFMPFWNSAFAIVGGTFAADTNRDRDLTLGELYVALSGINGRMNDFKGVAYARNFGEPAARLNIVVARLPLPGTIWLFGFGLIVLFVLKMRRLDIPPG